MVLFSKTHLLKIRGVVIKFAKAISQIRQVAVTNAVISKTLKIKYAVRQWIVLTATHVLTYVIDIVHIKDFPNTVFIAHDTSLIFSNEHTYRSLHRRTYALNVYVHGKFERILANLRKKYRLFKSKRAQTSRGVHLSFQSTNLQHTSTILCLGVIFHWNLFCHRMFMFLKYTFLASWAC